MARQDREATSIDRGQGFTHLDPAGRPRMVDVGEKQDTVREATAAGEVRVSPNTMQKIAAGQIAKGDVLAVAQVAGTLAAKRTWELIPLCHQLLLNAVNIRFSLNHSLGRIEIEATVRTTGKTGVEMEALTAVTVAALTVYDMCKAIDRSIVIHNVRLLTKSGGRSGTWRRDEEKTP